MFLIPNSHAFCELRRSVVLGHVSTMMVTGQVGAAPPRVPCLPSCAETSRVYLITT